MGFDYFDLPYIYHFMIHSCEVLSCAVCISRPYRAYLRYSMYTRYVLLAALDVNGEITRNALIYETMLTSPLIGINHTQLPT